MAQHPPRTHKVGWRGLCTIGGVAALILLVYSLITMVLLATLGGQPRTVEEAFALLQENRLVGLLRLDLLTVCAMPLFYLLYAGIYAALRRPSAAFAGLAASLAFAGVTLVLATPSIFAMAYLSDQFAVAVTVAQKSILLSAGQTLIAADMWHGTGAIMGAILLQSAGVLVSVVMLQSRVFGRLTAWVGVVTHGLDLAHILVSLFAPRAGVILIAVAGPFYLIWFPLVGRRLYRLGRTDDTIESQ